MKKVIEKQEQKVKDRIPLLYITKFILYLKFVIKIILTNLI
jgi:hypothetical protein